MRRLAIAMVWGIGVAGLASSALAQDGPLPRAVPIGNPGAWIPPNGYPPGATASQEEGRVAFKLTIDETGRVSDCKVTTSSESPLLDETTCNYMTANGRFTPPRDKKNKPVASQWSSSVTWKLETPAPAPPPPGTPAAPPPPVRNRKYRLNLILLLSALLSALSGTTGVRAPATPAALSSSVAGVVRATAAAQVRASSRPVQAIAGPAHAVIAAPPAFAFDAAIPPFASRRRE